MADQPRTEFVKLTTDLLIDAVLYGTDEEAKHFAYTLSSAIAETKAVDDGAPLGNAAARRLPRD